MTNINIVSTGFLGTNCYIVNAPGNDGCVLIDPGADAKKIEAYLNGAGLTPKAVLLTHAHFDHIGAVRHFQRGGCKVYLHKTDAETVLPESIARLSVEEFKPDCFVDDGDTIDLFGMTFTVMHTPGHSAGSVCYICEDSIYSGDTLFYLSVGRTDFNTGSHAGIKASLKKLFSLQKDYKVYPGHGRSTGLMFEKNNNPYA